jgi:hypothetical protein
MPAFDPQYIIYKMVNALSQGRFVLFNIPKQESKILIFPLDPNIGGFFTARFWTIEGELEVDFYTLRAQMDKKPDGAGELSFPDAEALFGLGVDESATQESFGSLKEVALAEPLSDQVLQRYGVKNKLQAPAPHGFLTSELAELYQQKQEEKYKNEFLRRLATLNLTPEIARRTWDNEIEILTQSEVKGRTIRWLQRYYFVRGTQTVERMLALKPNLTLSELYMITDEAIYAYKKRQKQMDEATKETVRLLSGNAPDNQLNTFYSKELKSRLLNLGWTNEQISQFIQKESFITAMFKWSYDISMDSNHW